MTKLALKSIALFILIITVLGSCKKENEPSIAITKENLVGTYKLTAWTAKYGDFPEQNVYDTELQPCEKDDHYKLNLDLTFNLIDAGTQCDPVGDFSGTWSLEADNKIVIDGQSADIQKFTAKELIVTSVYDNGGGIITTFKQTYIRL